MIENRAETTLDDAFIRSNLALQPVLRAQEYFFYALCTKTIPE
jgi:hypothetical protein